SLICAVYGALPAGREDPLLDRVGWPLAFAFLLNGVWEVSVLLRQPLLLQVLIACIFVCAGIAYLRLARSERGVLSWFGRWLVAPTIGLLFGWITAANAVSLNDTLVDLGLMGSGVGAALVGAGLLLAGALVACAVVLVGKPGPPQGYLAYAAAVLWGLAAIVVNQYDASLLTTGAAVLSAVLIALVLFVAPGGSPSRRRAGPYVLPRGREAEPCACLGGLEEVEDRDRFGSEEKAPRT
ncbi:MAG: hypothetical protein ACRDTR_15445, partial [Rubrobacter sp.]